MSGISTPSQASSGGGGGSSSITSLLGITTAGQKAMAGSLSVAIASDQSTLPVSLAANQSVNVAQFGGSSVTIGQQLAAASIPVILPSATITTLTPPTSVTVTQGTAANLLATVSIASAQTLATVTNVSQISGVAPTYNSTATSGKQALDMNILSILGTAPTTAGFIDIKGADGNVFVRQATAGNLLATVNIRDGAGNALTTNSTTTASKFALDQNIISILGTAPTTAGFIDVKGADGNVFVRQATASNFNAQVVGSIASGSSDSGNPVKIGGIAINTEQTAVTNAQRVNAVYDLTGKQIIMPYANKENFLSGTATATGTAAASVISAQGAGVKIYITRAIIANTGVATSLVTIQNDPLGTPSTLAYSINPAGGGSNMVFDPPLVSAANKAVGWTPGSSSTTQYITLIGYLGS